MKNRIFLVENWTSSELSDDAVYAVVVLTDSLLQTIKNRKKLIEAMNCLDDNLTSMEYYDLTPDFFSRTEAKKLIAPTGKTLDEFMEGGDMVEIGDDELSGDVETESLGYCNMICTSSGFYWEMSPKHTALRVETPKFRYDAFFENEEER